MIQSGRCAWRAGTDDRDTTQPESMAPLWRQLQILTAASAVVCTLAHVGVAGGKARWMAGVAERSPGAEYCSHKKRLRPPIAELEDQRTHKLTHASGCIVDQLDMQVSTCLYLGK